MRIQDDRSPDHPVTLFVYGTLQTAQAGDLNTLTPSPEYVGSGCVRGRLYDLGHCPALVLDDRGPPVWGEVYRVSAALFDALDRWERRCGDFRLRHTDVELDGIVIRCATYAAGDTQPLPAQPMASGRWPRVRQVHARQLAPQGDSALLIDLSHEPKALRLATVAGVARALRHAQLTGIVDIVEAPASVMVHYEPRRVRAATQRLPLSWLCEQVRGLPYEATAVGGTEHLLPVCYDASLAPDLAATAQHLGCSAETLVQAHLDTTYDVSCVGFLPGFAYLTGLDRRWHAPRLAQPRTRVPAGSVGLGGEYTGAYPDESPGGWRLIGRTPVRLFDPHRAQPSLLAVGDTVRLHRIDLDAFARMDRDARRAPQTEAR